MRLFRAISLGEYSTPKRGRFTVGPNSMEGKWFAESPDDAFKWGESMVFDPTFVVVEIELPDEIAHHLFRLNLLDGIGPARYASLEDLTEATIIGFKNVT